MFAWLPNKRFDFAPIGLAFIIRGLLSLYLLFSVPLIVFVIEATIWLFIGSLLFFGPSKIKKRETAAGIYGKTNNIRVNKDVLAIEMSGVYLKGLGLLDEDLYFKKK